MTWDNRIIWSEGTFLQPQHFQQHDRHIDAQLELRTRALRPYPWGFLELAVDESLLELGKLAVRSARCAPRRNAVRLPGPRPAPAAAGRPGDAAGRPRDSVPPRAAARRRRGRPGRRRRG